MNMIKKMAIVSPEPPFTDDIIIIVRFLFLTRCSSLPVCLSSPGTASRRITRATDASAALPLPPPGPSAEISFGTAGESLQHPQQPQQQPQLTSAGGGVSGESAVVSRQAHAHSAPGSLPPPQYLVQPAAVQSTNNPAMLPLQPAAHAHLSQPLPRMPSAPHIIPTSNITVGEQQVLSTQQQQKSTLPSGHESLWAAPSFIPHVHTILAMDQAGPPPALGGDNRRSQPQVSQSQVLQSQVLQSQVLQQSNKSNIKATAAAKGIKPPQKAPLGGSKPPQHPSGGTGEGKREAAAPTLTQRSQGLSDAVRRLAAGIRGTSETLAPPRRADLAEEDVRESRRRVLELELQMETQEWQPPASPTSSRPRPPPPLSSAIESSPQPTHGVDSTRLSFKPQSQHWESMARRRVDGTGTEAQVREFSWKEEEGSGSTTQIPRERYDSKLSHDSMITGVHVISPI